MKEKKNQRRLRHRKKLPLLRRRLLRRRFLLLLPVPKSVLRKRCHFFFFHIYPLCLILYRMLKNLARTSLMRLMTSQLRKMNPQRLTIRNERYV